MGERLWRNTNFYKGELAKIGFNTMDSKTPIVPILIGDDEVTERFCQRLCEEGLYVTKIGTPYVPEGTSRLRTIVTAAHNEEDIGEAVAILKSVGSEFRII